MIELIHEGGWPIFVVIAFGAALLAAAFRYSHEGKPELLGVVLGLGAATLLAGAFGTVAGFMMSAKYLHELPADDRWVALMKGLQESLGNLELSLVFAFAGSLLLTRGFWRRAKLIPPHKA